MSSINIVITRPLNTEELRELFSLAQHQESTEKFTNATLDINGDSAKIKVKIDKYGNITVL